MADELTATGLSIDTYPARLALRIAEARTAISAILDCGEDQPVGQVIRITTEHAQQLGELLQELYSAIDPDQATGQSLDAVCSITGTYRNAATNSTAALLLGFTAGPTIVPAGSIVSVAGDPDNQWTTDTAVNYVGPGVGFDTVNATATTTGPLAAPMNTITVIDTPVFNWSGVTNPADAIEGAARETDTALRLRREVELTTGGSTSVDAVAAAVSQVTGITEVIVYENDSWRPAAPMPPHSIEVVYTGSPVAATLAQEIFEEKAGGIKAYGTAYTAHTDTQGNVHQIGTTAATELRLILNFVLVTDSDYPGHADFAAAIVTAVNANQGIADDVLLAKMYDFAFNVAGVVNVTTLQLAWFGDPLGVLDLSVSARFVATLLVGDVAVA